jgi:mono/diheme cytochrome c family protein
MKTTRALVAIPLLVTAFAACSSARNEDHPSPTLPSAPPGPKPEFGPLVQQADPPPPISGGTLAIAPDGTTAVAADPDRDQIHVVDLASRALRHTVALPHRSEPGRVAIDDQGYAYVALRTSGGIATVNLETGALAHREACAAPRGVAFNAAKRAIVVACADGQLVTLDLASGDRSAQNLGRDLRDVVIFGGGRAMMVTQFREARLMRVGSAGDAHEIPGLGGANLAWRAVALPTPECPDCTAGAVVAQEPTPEPVSPEPGGYGGMSGFGAQDCSSLAGILSTRLELFPSTASVRLPGAVLPVDLATNGRELAVVAAGNAFTKDLPQIFVVHADAIASASGRCPPTVQGDVPGQAIAAAFDGDDQLIVQTREPAALHIMTEDRRRTWKTIPLAAGSRQDTGHAIFHANAGAFIACASCHAEGGDDAHTWEFVGMGPRRTPSMLGTLANTEPFHWVGDMADIQELVDHVFVERMNGPEIDHDQVDALRSWLFALPAPPPLRQPDAETARGGQLFQQRCSSCHAGPMLTNNQTVDVGTGDAFQVPSLVGVSWRAPFLHNGCATTLLDRFDPACGGDKHGDLSGLGAEQLRDLASYLETL